MLCTNRNNPNSFAVFSKILQFKHSAYFSLNIIQSQICLSEMPSRRKWFFACSVRNRALNIAQGISIPDFLSSENDIVSPILSNLFVLLLPRICVQNLCFYMKSLKRKRRILIIFSVYHYTKGFHYFIALFVCRLFSFNKKKRRHLRIIYDMK
jgi:hypothetical protein